MSLIKWSPFFEPYDGMEKMIEEMQSLTSRSPGGIIPPVDMYETKEAVVVEAPIAGIDPKNIEVSIDSGVLTIKGQSQRKTEVEEKDFYRKEIRQGTVFRQITLPASVKSEGAEADYNNGVLKISLPKADQKKSISVKIKDKSENKKKK